VAERQIRRAVSADTGEAVAYALWKLQERGRMLLSRASALYEAWWSGVHSRDNDSRRHPIREKHLTNIRAAGRTSDPAPPRRSS